MAANITTQHTLAIAPSPREDIVSALLSDYGNSFGPGDPSPSAYSPAPAAQELPPHPPRSDSIARKPLPASERMDAKFQLRDDQDAPVSPSSSVEGSPQSRKRIVSRSLSRGSRPASLKLVISNGSTATIPSPPAVSVPSNPSASADSAAKDLPPPPPPKSERRANEREDMGNKASKQARELARNDSLLSQGKSTDATSPVVKRKAVPEPSAKSFKSLAELGNGPRGRRGAPVAPTSAPRDENVQVQASMTETGESKAQENARAIKAQQLPPTPDDDKDEPESLAQPKKVFGLPSNPRVNSLGSPVSVRSNASMGVLKAHRPAPPIPTMNIRPTTPEPTPSPTLKPIMARRDCEISPVSPLPPPSNPRTSSVYEASPIEAEPQQQPRAPVASNPAPPYAPTPPINAKPPARITSLEFPARSDSRPLSAPSRPTSMGLDTSNLSPSPGPSVPSSPVGQERSSPEITVESSEPMEPVTPPPFVPLTQQSIPLPLTLIPQITNKHVQCYTRHAQNIWSNNVFQPMGCMVCRENTKERKWACTWCQLRICKACSDELLTLPGRDLGLLLEEKSRREQGVEYTNGKSEHVGGNMGVEVYDAEERF